MAQEASNYIDFEMIKDIESGRYSYIQTRQPPEPSGYLHIAHVRGIMLNYGLAQKYGGVCNLRFDDTNPIKENNEFVESIKADVKWLGYKWKNIHFATDYFHKNYEIALKLIKEGKAYVCDLSPADVAASRGTPTTSGTESPYRCRSVEENLNLFERMKSGEFEQGSRCLRAKINMAHPNLLMRDPVIYRIQFAHHHRIGSSWKIYPTYDFSHPLDDSLEGVTHSICGSEFIEHRPLYDWVVENSGLEHKSRQVEYYNIYLENVILGKRHIKKLVENGVVSGFDDPRLYTLAALRRRGVLPESIKNFITGIGLGKEMSIINVSFLDSFIRETLNERAKRVMAVLNPLKLIITNYPKGEEEEIFIESYPQIKENTERHSHYFSRELLIERDDFMVEPIPKYHRLFPGNEVRLKGAYIVKCTGFDFDETGEVTCVYAEYDPSTKSGGGSIKKVKSTIHFINPNHAKRVEVRMFENLFEKALPNELEDEKVINGLKLTKNSKIILENAFVEEIEYTIAERYQFLRNGYYCLDKDSCKEALVFNRTITLKDPLKLPK